MNNGGSALPHTGGVSPRPPPSAPPAEHFDADTSKLGGSDSYNNNNNNNNNFNPYNNSFSSSSVAPSPPPLSSPGSPYSYGLAPPPPVPQTNPYGSFSAPPQQQQQQQQQQLPVGYAPQPQCVMPPQQMVQYAPMPPQQMVQMPIVPQPVVLVVPQPVNVVPVVASSALMGLQRKFQKGTGSGCIYLCICQATLPKLEALMVDEKGKKKSVKLAVFLKYGKTSTEISKVFASPQALWIEVLIENVRFNDEFTIEFRSKKVFSSANVGAFTTTFARMWEIGGAFATQKLGLTEGPGDVELLWQFSEYFVSDAPIIRELPPLRVVMERTVLAPGDTVSGIMSYAVRSKQKEIQSVQLRICGCISFQTQHKDNQNRPDVEITEFMTFQKTLSNATTLVPGLYSWKFTCRLPPHLPRSSGLVMFPFFGFKIDYGIEAKVAFVRNVKYPPRFAGLPFTVLRRDVSVPPVPPEIHKAVIDIPSNGGQILLQAHVVDAHIRPMVGTTQSAVRLSVTLQNASKKMRPKQMMASVYAVVRIGIGVREYYVGGGTIDMMPYLAGKGGPGDVCTFEFSAPLSVPFGFHHEPKDATRRFASFHVSSGRMNASVAWKVRLFLSVANVMSYATNLDVPFHVAAAPAEYEEFFQLPADFDPLSVNTSAAFPLDVEFSDSQAPLQDPVNFWARDIGLRTCGSSDKYIAPGVVSINHRNEPEAHCSINWALSTSENRFNFK